MIHPIITYGALFKALSQAQVCSDDKILADAIPKMKPSIILERYLAEKDNQDFEIKVFFENHFTTRQSYTNFKSDSALSTSQHIDNLWDILTRQPDHQEHDTTLLPLPHPYVVPGGRFNEIYYWDSYFTMVGLKASGRFQLVRDMVNNFAYLITTYGYIPNGNRSYFMSRSQPPFFSLMVQLLVSIDGEDIYNKYLPALLTEYQWWMSGAEKLTIQGQAEEHCVAVRDADDVLNRYYDNDPSPRIEMYRTDVQESMHMTPDQSVSLFGHIRAACESGWDFSSRWMEDPLDMHTIHTLDIIPVDLNCLMAHLEYTIGRAIDAQGNAIMAQQYHKKSRRRKELINELMWKDGFYYDWNHKERQHTKVKTSAACFPLFFKIASFEQAKMVAKVLEDEFLHKGGLITTTQTTTHQWDAPNGWAPLQYIAIEGLRRYKQNDLADEIAARWIQLCDRVYNDTGKMLEKYNVVDIDLPTGGGEYPVQDGFGWTNGVYLALYKGII